MDTKSLIQQAQVRFEHNKAKQLLKEKYTAKLLVADQGGLWLADKQTIGFLNSMDDNFIILTDTYDNPIQVNTQKLLEVLTNTYNNVMLEWYKELKELERKR